MAGTIPQTARGTMNNGIINQFICMMQMYCHRMVIGPPLTEFEHLCYEQLARTVTAVAEYNRFEIEKHLPKEPKDD
jgi:hypothetical protein